jgi:hypothetical protein
MTQEQYDETLTKQGGGCAICKEVPVPGVLFDIDYDYATNKVHGILCHGCLVMLTGAQYQTHTLEQGVQYLLNYWRKLR